MSDEKEWPKFELRMRKGATGLMTGAKTELLMDGRRLSGVSKVRIEVEARGLAKIFLEMFGQFEVTGNLEPEVTLSSWADICEFCKGYDTEFTSCQCDYE